MKNSVERIIVQSDWDELVGEETFWVQFKNSQAPAINGKLSFKAELEQRNLCTGFKILALSKNKRWLKISYTNDEQEEFIRKFVAPKKKFTLHLNEKNVKQPVLSIDVSDGGLGVSASNNGSLLIWLNENGQVRRHLDGHISDVNVCKFFPSGVVVLSGGADLRIKIWSAENGQCAATLTGHAYGVSDLCVVEKGRNVVSVSRDGSCKLWDVGESKCLADVAKFDCVINGCSIQSVNHVQNLPESEEPLSEREIGTENKIIACACEDGFLRVLALRSRKLIYEYKCESAVNCCCFIDETTIACGTQNGFIHLIDLRKLDAIVSLKEFRSSILSMQKAEPLNDLIVTTADGSCFFWNCFDRRAIIELTGSDCDPVYKAACNSTHVFTCCRDGLIRKYDRNDILND